MSTAVAERYARAIFELGVETNQLSSLSEEIGRFAGALSGNAELQNALENPLVPEAQREQVVTALGARLSMSPLAINAVRLLVRRRRIRILSELCRELVSLADHHLGIVRATVTTSKPLDEAFYQKLASQIGAATSKQVKLDRRVDASLIAGVVTTIGDNTIDGSLRGRLQAFVERLTHAT